MKKRIIDLQIFAEDPAPNPDPKPNPNPAPNPQPAAQIDYEKLAQIVAGKQSVTEDSVLRGYFKQQGLSKEDADKAIAEFKDRQKQNDPAVKMAELQKKVDQYEQEKLLSKKNVRQEDYDYVIFKASRMVDDKTTFEKAVDKFLKENPRFTSAGGYRVDTGVTGGSNGSGAHGENENETVNQAIRNAFRR